MRPTRLLLSILLAFLTVFLALYSVLLSRSGRAPAAATVGGDAGSAFGSFFSFHAPASLFPPSAIITLTDDNSTFFFSRPAAYGPALPAQGLSGQLWVGSGFWEDLALRDRDGVSAKAEGELGCSDIEGWPPYQVQGDAAGKEKQKTKSARRADGGKAAGKGSSEGLQQSSDGSALPDKDDSTDEHLHYPLKAAPLLRPSANGKDAKKSQQPAEHADIQSLQESAEIAGKVVLLSRGGCGFLEKTKWVQRRGGIALIVGDNIRGGPLVNMFARGDTSNVSIPSIFTSHTTAHLLSSLMPPEGNFDADGASSGKQEKEGASKPANDGVSGPNFTPMAAGPNTPTTTARLGKVTAPSDPSDSTKQGKGWLKKIFADGNSDAKQDSRRPPSSGQLSWVQSNDWNDEPRKGAGDGPKKAAAKGNGEKSTDANAGNAKEQGSSDGFVIGVQDWRDPDLVNKGDADVDANSQATGTSTSLVATSTSTKAAAKNALPGGSRTPGSGVYKPNPASAKKASKSAATSPPSSPEPAPKRSGWLSRLFGRARPTSATPPLGDPAAALPIDLLPLPGADDPLTNGPERRPNAPPAHRGLWVTMTPTTVSTSPFFDTMLVLVVSPLVTLTVVYALLLLRARLRRRRWRAPKALVDRLPVRTYHTMTPFGGGSSSSSSSRLSAAAALPSPGAAASGPASPLLRSVGTGGSGGGAGNAERPRPRPRSQTLAVLRRDASAALDRATARLALEEAPAARRKAGAGAADDEAAAAAEDGGEKEAAPRSPRRYRGRQVECVVCLEEYVDGQSRVMSLPCGHEFHAACITPWLTTRRRTCPICKGDVVRSLTHAAAEPRSAAPSLAETEPLLVPYGDDDEGARPHGAAAAIDIPGDGRRPPADRGSWRGLVARSARALGGGWMAARSAPRSPASAPADRSR